MRILLRILLVTGISSAAFFLAASLGQRVNQATAQDTPEDLPKRLLPHALSPKNFPCSKCHRYTKANPERRKLELAHTTILIEHAAQQRWCLDCHDGDKLRLPNGELIGYEYSFMLCAQCHGTVFRDWKAGIHGKRTGAWNGEKLYRLCVSCHDAHQPKFKPMEPKAPPLRPVDLR
jgi:hypothetical protein